MTDLETTLADIAAGLGVPADALDAFVFRRLDGGRMVHLGGAGRADGWAGVVEINLESEPLIAHVWSVRHPVHQCGPASNHVFGPYWAHSAIVVPLVPDQLVIFGSSASLGEPADAELERMAWQLVSHVAAVSPAKRLADELELLHAVRRATSVADTDVRGAAEHIVRAAAEALSCELGLLWVPERDVLAIADLGPAALATGDGDGLITMMESMLEHPEQLPRCQQDNGQNPLPAPLGADSGVVAWFAVALAAPARGLLLLCHTIAKPRGFTLLCQQIGTRIAEAATTPLAVALAHERLNAELTQASTEARHDPLTGVANRLGWQEALSGITRDRRSAAASVIMLDLDELKQVNDEHGHRAGDDMLRAVAGVLRDCTRDADVVARVGGDEFAVLLPGTAEDACGRVVDRIVTSIADLTPIGGHPVTASVGWATCPDADGLDDVLRLADLRMYDAKRTRARD